MTNKPEITEMIEILRDLFYIEQGKELRPDNTYILLHRDNIADALSKAIQFIEQAQGIKVHWEACIKKDTEWEMGKEYIVLKNSFYEKLLIKQAENKALKEQLDKVKGNPKTEKEG
uniref:Uncharacterized protein n=1 Tax=viral metagenome TaxID=1070528 RepID=A0A6H1ZWC7_9ZZZZ